MRNRFRLFFVLLWISFSLYFDKAKELSTACKILQKLTKKWPILAIFLLQKNVESWLFSGAKWCIIISEW